MHETIVPIPIPTISLSASNNGSSCASRSGSCDISQQEAGDPFALSRAAIESGYWSDGRICTTNRGSSHLKWPSSRVKSLRRFGLRRSSRQRSRRRLSMNPVIVSISCRSWPGSMESPKAIKTRCGGGIRDTRRRISLQERAALPGRASPAWESKSETQEKTAAVRNR